MFTVVMIDVWVYTPFVMVLALAGLKSLPKAPYEAAQLDGGSAWFTFRTLTLPMITPHLLIALIFRLMVSLQEFSIIFAATKGGPGDTLLSLSLNAYNTGFLYNNLGPKYPADDGLMGDRLRCELGLSQSLGRSAAACGRTLRRA